MNASTDDRRALRQALRQVKRLAEEAEASADTDAMKAGLMRVWVGAVNTYELIKAIEDNTRNAAIREVEVRLEQMVGMPLETL